MSNKADNGTDLVAVLKGELPVRLGDPQEAALAIVERILAAPDIESVFTIAGTMGADDVLNQPFHLNGVEFRKSEFEQGSPVYAIIMATMVDTGEDIVLTCGGQNVTAQLAVAQKYGGPPWPIKLTRNERPTAAGFHPLWLQKA